jgi:hypothetical protein
MNRAAMPRLNSTGTLSGCDRHAVALRRTGRDATPPPTRWPTSPAILWQRLAALVEQRLGLLELTGQPQDTGGEEFLARPVARAAQSPTDAAGNGRASPMGVSLPDSPPATTG